MSRKKNRPKQSKQRITEVRVDFGKPVTLSGTEQKAGKLVFYDEQGKKIDPVFIEVGEAYLRENKSKYPKVTSRSTAMPDDIVVNPHHLAATFDILYAIDTNSIVINDVKISVTVPIKFVVRVEGDIGHITYELMTAFEFHNADINPEIIGWHDLLKNVIKSEDYNEQNRIGFVVDSELDRISAINKRTEPVIDNFFLPSNIRMMYASSDVSREYTLNKMIAMCDAKGRGILDRIRDSKGAISSSWLQKSENHHYSSYCYWSAPKP